MTTGPSADYFQSAGTDYGPGGHRYNDDLLLAQPARDRASLEHGNVFHLLDHRELRDAFRPQNDEANIAKRRAHVAGFWSVTLAFLALALAAGEPFWGRLASPAPFIIAIFSGALGLISILISAVWLIFGKRKAAWLHKRFFTERLRQYHFQAFVWRLPEMAESLDNGEDTKEKYREARNESFNVFLDDLNSKSDSQMSRLLDPAGPPRVWVNNVEFGREPEVPDANLQDIFRAYDIFRFDEQEGYADFVLRRSNKPDAASRRSFPWWYPGINQPIKRKRAVLTGVWIGALVSLIIVHVLIVVSNMGGWQAWQPAHLHVAIVWFALLAVGAKTLSEGLTLTREIERYEEYRAIVVGLKQAFQIATNPRTKVRIMMDMERAAFEEMRAFLRSHNDATFIM
jgi:hypothetical protein